MNSSPQPCTGTPVPAHYQPAVISAFGNGPATPQLASPAVTTPPPALLNANHLLPTSPLSSHLPPQTPPPQPRLVVFSGGTAFNSVAGKLQALTTNVSYVLPVSDDGGSTAEIVRVLGGPAVGDIRSRCLRLADSKDSEGRALVKLLHHRLSVDEMEARAEWETVVQGDHVLWEGISDEYHHTIRRFLILFHSEVLQASNKNMISANATRFRFRNGSIGNFFFAGARIFFGSLDAAIFLFSRVARISEGSAVLPAILTDDVITLSAECSDGSLIRGQNNISHPPQGADAGVVDKDEEAPLPSGIRRVFYMSQEGHQQEHEVHPPVNPRVLGAINKADAVVYGMGSLYTSIIPCLALEEVGETIAARSCPKLLLLNGTHDRESSVSLRSGRKMTATDTVLAITDALNRKHHPRRPGLSNPPSAYVEVVVAPIGGEIEVDESELEAEGIRKVVWAPARLNDKGRVVYDVDALVQVLGTAVGCHVCAESLKHVLHADEDFLTQ